MALLQTLHLEHLPSSHAIHVALYRDVKNVTHLQQQLLNGNTDFEYAFIDAGVVSIAAALLFIAPLISERFCALHSYHVITLNVTDLW
jgi:EKC/KEOPS complex subunit CGI121/TPRKB